jgi:hypothetical protein
MARQPRAVVYHYATGTAEFTLLVHHCSPVTTPAGTAVGHDLDLHNSNLGFITCSRWPMRSGCMGVVDWHETCFLNPRLAKYTLFPE